MRAGVERGESAASVAHAAMRLAAKMVELITLANEQAILVGEDRMTSSIRNIPEKESRNPEWDRWQAEADDVRVDQPNISSVKRISELVKDRLALAESVSIIRRRIK